MPGTPFEDAVVQVAPDGDVRLASGRSARLVDLRLRETAAPASGVERKRDATTFLATLAGAPVRVTPAGQPDRWGRLPASVALIDGATAIDLGELLVSEGLALVDSGERDALCAAGLLRLEAAARRSQLGLWAETRPLAAGEPESIRARLGGFAVVRGRILSVGERRDRTYLNFGRDFARDFSVVLTKRGWAALKAAGHSATSLRGRTVRVRGVVEGRRGPSMEIAATELIEIDPAD